MKKLTQQLIQRETRKRKHEYTGLGTILEKSKTMQKDCFLQAKIQNRKNYFTRKQIFKNYKSFKKETI